jgi:hypothetical protein
MAKQLLMIGLQEEIWMEVRSPLGVAWHGSRHFRHPTSRDHRRVHWASARGQAILDSWAILSLLLKKITDDKARLCHGKENTKLPRTLTACVLDAKMGALKKPFSS